MVEVIKSGGKKALVLDCHYPEDEVCRMESQHLGIPGDKEGGPPETLLVPFLA